MLAQTVIHLITAIEIFLKIRFDNWGRLRKKAQI